MVWLTENLGGCTAIGGVGMVQENSCSLIGPKVLEGSGADGWEGPGFCLGEALSGSQALRAEFQGHGWSGGQAREWLGPGLPDRKGEWSPQTLWLYHCPSCVTLDRLHDLCLSQFPYLFNVSVIVPTAKGGCTDDTHGYFWSPSF